MPTPLNLAPYLEHTLLRADASALDIKKLAMEAARFDMLAICVNAHYVRMACDFLKPTNVKVVSVVGFPLGASLSAIKAAEAAAALAEGAHEIDMVLNIGAFKSGDLMTVEADVRAVKKACGLAKLKVILETALLSEAEIAQATKLAVKAGADFIKTSTGFSTRGATLQDIAIIKKALGSKTNVQIKASGGIKNYADALALVKAGASRIGTSQGVSIMLNEREITSANTY